MKMPPAIVTLEGIAQKVGVPAQRFPFLRKVYEDNRHNPTLMHQQLQSPTLSKQEVVTIMAYIGAVIAGQAIDEELYRSNTPE